MAGRKHLIAVNRTVAGAGLDERGEHAAIVEMARNLARRMDSVGSDEPPMSLVKSFQSALKDLQRAAGSKAPPKPGRNGIEVGARPNVLEEFRRRWRVRPEDRLEPGPLPDVSEIDAELERSISAWQERRRSPHS